MQYFKNENGDVYAYDDDCSEEFILEGLTPISEEAAMALLAPPPSSKEELSFTAEVDKARLRAKADSQIVWLQDAVDAAMATDDETASLAAWKKYRIMLMRVDTSADDIAWPENPA